MINLSINKDTKLCISISARPSNFGTRFQNFLFQHYGLNFIYKAFQVEDLEGTLRGIRALGIRGSAVSMPFKERCMEFLDCLDISAQKIQSVNTIVNSDGKLKGYNTDYSAVLNLLRSQEIPKDVHFVLHGSGGMAQAVLYALREAGFNHGVILARNKTKAKLLAKETGYEWVSSIEHLAPDFLINATPIGMAGGVESDLLSFSEQDVKKAQWIMDVVALPSETPLIKISKNFGKKIIQGSQIVALQAKDQFVLYTGVEPSRDVVDQAVLFALDLK